MSQFAVTPAGVQRFQTSYNLNIKTHYVRPMSNMILANRVSDNVDEISMAQIRVEALQTFGTASSRALASSPEVNGGSTAAISNFYRGAAPNGFRPTSGFNWTMFPVVHHMSAANMAGSGLPKEMVERFNQISQSQQRVNFSENNVIVLPYACIVSTHPMMSIMSHVGVKGHYEPLTKLPGDITVYMETTLRKSHDENSKLAIIGALRATVTPDSWGATRVFVTIVPYISSAEVAEWATILTGRLGITVGVTAQAFQVSGVSLGLAVAAAAMGAPSIAYTGYLSSFGSDKVLANVDGGTVNIIQGADLVETVEHISAKASWAIYNRVPMCIPHNPTWRNSDDMRDALIRAAQAMLKFHPKNSPPGHTESTYFNRALGASAAEEALKINNLTYPFAMARAFFGMQDVAGGIHFMDGGSYLLTCTSLLDAWVLACIAYLSLTPSGSMDVFVEGRGAVIEKLQNATGDTVAKSRAKKVIASTKTTEKKKKTVTKDGKRGLPTPKGKKAIPKRMKSKPSGADLSTLLALLGRDPAERSGGGPLRGGKRGKAIAVGSLLGGDDAGGGGYGTVSGGGGGGGGRDTGYSGVEEYVAVPGAAPAAQSRPTVLVMDAPPATKARKQQAGPGIPVAQSIKQPQSRRFESEGAASTAQGQTGAKTGPRITSSETTRKQAVEARDVARKAEMAQKRYERSGEEVELPEGRQAGVLNISRQAKQDALAEALIDGLQNKNIFTGVTGLPAQAYSRLRQLKRAEAGLPALGPRYQAAVPDLEFLPEGLPDYED